MTIDKNNPGNHNPDKEKIRAMFNDIARRYDFLNHFLSGGIDIVWRRKVRRILAKKSPSHILDVATGTGDLAIELSKLHPKSITGVDIAVNMLDIGRDKILQKNLSEIITFEEGDAENLRFKTDTFDAVTVAFGVRNFETLQKGLQEMYRVIAPNGTLVVLEFSKPRLFPFKQLYNIYSKYILPVMGRSVSKSKEAYTYLPESVKAFAEGKVFLDELQIAGFTNVFQKRLTFGIATIYVGEKSQPSSSAEVLT